MSKLEEGRQIRVEGVRVHVVDEGQMAGNVLRGPIAEVAIEQTLVASVVAALTVSQGNEFLERPH